MRFLSTGDFNFPFEITAYWVKHAFIWSFQSGTPNPDGLIRLPGRVFNFIVFALFGNVGVSYFYIFAPLIIAFFSFYFFARHFLQIKSRSVQFMGALFFACNPIFLGNIAKIGLVLAAAMLPLCLLAIQATFQKRQVRYLLLLILCINISFLHPYTFTVNLAVSAIYFIYMTWHHKAFVIDNIFKLLLVGVAAIGLNLYFALPMLSMGSVSKDMISTNITPTPIDYTALVGISNTGNFFTGFSLSKNVFVDFAFYNDLYQNIYFFGVFLFYVVLLWLILRAEPNLRPAHKRQLALLLGAFLALIALAATTVLHIDSLIKFLISMPGGWAFRSPLKWQLYIPMALFGVMVIVLSQVKNQRMLRTAQGLLLLTFVIMNGYICLDVYRKILVPRTLTNFSSLYETDMNQKTVLFVNNGPCMDYMRANPRVVTELNQVFASKNTQLKNVLADNLAAVNLASYDYLITCKPESAEYLKPYPFKQIDNYADNTFQLYRNQKSTGRIFALDQIFNIQKPQATGQKYDFVSNNLGEQFSFVQLEGQTKYPVTNLHDVFENVSPKSIQQGIITSDLSASQGQTGQLKIRPSNKPLYYMTDDRRIAFSTTKQAQARLIPAGEQQTIDLKKGQQAVSYTDPGFDYKNLIRNPSFEEGLWRKNVDDCYKFDNNPSIGMKLEQGTASDGNQSLQLQALRHIACTGPGAIKVRGGEHYLLSFDYQSKSGKYAGYYVSFDDPKKTTDIVRMQESGEDWHSFSQELTVPKNASHINIKFYAYPHSYGESTSIVGYDNTSLIRTPPMQDRFYAITAPKNTIQTPGKIAYEIHDPTKKIVHIKNAKHGFYLADTDSFHPLWQLSSGKAVLPDANHIKLNNTMNAWYIEPRQICAQSGSRCQKQNDGSYNITATIEFKPQRWFYVGAAVSSLTFALCVTYFIRSHKKTKNGEGYHL